MGERRGGARRPASAAAARIVALLLVAATLAWPVRAQPSGDSGFEGVPFGITSDELLQRFGTRATRLDRRLDVGQAYVDVVLRRYELGGYPFIVFFQMDRGSGRLLRIQVERPRHGAVAMVHQAALAALVARYGTPDAVCQQRLPRPGGQAIDERIWRRDGVVIRLVFREQSLGVIVPRKLEPFDWEVWEPSPEGLPQQLFVRFAPAGSEPDDCGKGP